ncbi:unnamed protein product [Rhizoctonia solani]|uniref:Transmembrane protein n=1 Tax=Rhizoctonia solani TaxID=456999 RepID=A0A8H3DJ12_9AGAM|nr:unnamed protein product [Rhizoctonia solani]CAE6530422.1 unnamed protein product [Rhizoctonia solani]
MAANNEISFVDTQISSAPEGASPFAYAANYVSHFLLTKPDWYFKQIIVAGVLNGMSFILTLVSFVIVARRRKTANEVGSLWFFRAHYGHPSRIPYLMPNPLTMFLVWNFIFSSLMQPYTWLNYFAWKYPSRAITSKVYFWYGFVFIFDGAGMWMSAVGTLYATLLPRVLFGSERKISVMLHPSFLNFMCFGMPTLLTITQTITASLSQVAWSKTVNLQFDLVDNLLTLSSQWLASDGASVDASLRQRVSVDGNNLLKAMAKSRSAFSINAGAAAAWYFLCMILFSPTAVWLLITLKRAAEQLYQNSRSTSGQRPPSPGPNAASGQQQQGPAPVKPGEQFGQKRAIRRAYVTAALQFITTFLCLVVAVGLFMWVALDFDRVSTNPVAHAVAIILSDSILPVIGIIINILIIIRMTGKAEKTGSHPSNSQGSRHTHFRSLSNAPAVAGSHSSSSRPGFKSVKPIPLRIISTYQVTSDAELGMSYKAPLSENGGHSDESLGYHKNNQL